MLITHLPHRDEARSKWQGSSWKSLSVAYSWSQETVPLDLARLSHSPGPRPCILKRLSVGPAGGLWSSKSPVGRICRAVSTHPQPTQKQHLWSCAGLFCRLTEASQSCENIKFNHIFWSFIVFSTLFLFSVSTITNILNNCHKRLFYIHCLI